MDEKYYTFIKGWGLELFADQNKAKLTQMILTGETGGADYYNTPISIRNKDGELVGVVLGIRP
jgi:hypothetical protein